LADDKNLTEIIEDKLDNFLNENKGNKLSTHLTKGLKDDIIQSTASAEKAYLDIIYNLNQKLDKKLNEQNNNEE